VAYATPAQLCQQFDRRDIADLCAESSTAVNPATVENNPIAQAALERASGLILAAASIADQYTQDDLDELAANDDPFLIAFCCKAAMAELLQRRSVQKPGDPPTVAKEVQGLLDDLRAGKKIFNVSAVRDAGNVHLSTPTVVELVDAGLWTGLASGRIWPAREVV
jgi:phage gp36-like protein